MCFIMFASMEPPMASSAMPLMRMLSDIEPWTGGRRDPEPLCAVAEQGNHAVAARIAVAEAVIVHFPSCAVALCIMDLAVLLPNLSGSPLRAIPVVFVGGVLTSLTPCIYPMIPITAAIVGGTSVAEPVADGLDSGARTGRSVRWRPL